MGSSRSAGFCRFPPSDFLRRLAALVPAPYTNLVRFHEKAVRCQVALATPIVFPSRLPRFHPHSISATWAGCMLGSVRSGAAIYHACFQLTWSGSERSQSPKTGQSGVGKLELEQPPAKKTVL
jgi:hypothetical protein